MSKNVKLNVVFKSSERMKNAFRFKDILPKHINSKVFYTFNCNTCNSVDIDKTKRHLWTCEYEYLGLSVFMEKALKYTEKNCHQIEHRFSADDYEIVDAAVYYFHFKLKVFLFILKMNTYLKILQLSTPLCLFDNDISNFIGK